MAGEVIPFPDKRVTGEEDGKQWGSGSAFCLGCDHEWVAVAETGTVVLQCPSCKRHTGHWCFEFQPAEGQLVRSCTCKNQLFYLTPDGHMCANCGVYQAY